MHQRGGLQRLAGTLFGHLPGRQPAQFMIGQGQQFFRRLGITLLNRVQYEGNVTHLSDHSQIELAEASPNKKELSPEWRFVKP